MPLLRMQSLLDQKHSPLHDKGPFPFEQSEQVGTRRSPPQFTLASGLRTPVEIIFEFKQISYNSRFNHFNNAR